MNAESIARIDGILESAVTELFALHGIRLKRAESTELRVEEPFAATIGFTSERIAGALVLIASRELASQSLPANLKSPAASDSIIGDWSGELSNQVLGRLKTRLCAIGVEIALSTPTVFAGKELRHLKPAYPLSMVLAFEGCGALIVEIQASIRGDFEVSEEVEAENAAPPEGEALFF